MSESYPDANETSLAERPTAASEQAAIPAGEEAVPEHAPGRLFWLCFAACSVAALLPLWLVDFLPATDLPQHAAQIKLWQRWDAGLGRDLYKLNWFTPYLFGYSLVRLFAFFTEIETAIRIVLSGYVLALPLGMLAWLKALRRPHELALLAFPAAYGFSFQWGFFNYTVALPVALFFLALGETHLQRPTRRTTIGLALFSVFLFFAHVLILAACGVLLFGRALLLRRISATVVRLLPAATGALFVPPWILAVRASHGAARHSSTGWELGLQRFLDLPSLMFGLEGDRKAQLLGLLLLAWGLVSIVFALVRRRPGLLVAPAVALLLYAFIPSHAMNTFFLAPRFGVIVALVLIPMLALPRSRLGRGIALGAIVVGVGAWSTVTTQRFLGFDAEARGLNEVLEAAEPDKRLLGLTYDQGSRHFGGRPFLHFPAYYQARKGGEIGFSFAQFFPQLLRFRHGKQPDITPGLEWSPGRFDWNRDGGFDYLLVRSAKEPSLLKKNRLRARLVKASGSWRLYRIERSWPRRISAP